jgi:hypothetical protein
MARIPIQIGARLFSSKSDAKEFSRDIIRRYAEGVTIVGEDDLFLRDLVAIHPEAKQKAGCGIASFTTQLDPEWRKNRHFVVVRNDCTRTEAATTGAMSSTLCATQSQTKYSPFSWRHWTVLPSNACTRWHS